MSGSPERITSPGNELVRRARALRQRKAREDQGALLVEGIRPVWQALDHHAAVEVIFLAPDLLSSDAARTAAARAAAGGIRVVEVSGAVFGRLAEHEHPSGLAAIVRAPRHVLADVVVPPTGVLIALHEVGNPGNLGTILRTLDAIGGTALITIGESTDPHHPTAVKASMGTLFSVPTLHLDRAGDLLAWARARGITVIGASERAARTHWEQPPIPPCLLFLGHEGRGLPPEVLDACDQQVRIPMAGTAGSLNLAVAAGILLYETRRVQWVKGAACE
ncbi:MAG TPA: RNA methyltransferase [Chloroflexota bacterium]|nr:RNA methyltransferase [Chloroflexota bacterium]